MLKKLAVLTIAMFAVSAYAAEHKEPTEKNQKKLVKLAEKQKKKNQIEDSCKSYAQAFHMGYLGEKGDETNSKKNKIFVKAAIGWADCLTQTETQIPKAGLKGANIYYQLDKQFKIEGMQQKLIDLQTQKLKEASILKEYSAEDFLKSDKQTNQACESAKLGYQIGYLGSAELKKDPSANNNFVANGVFHSACISLNPKSKPNGSTDLANLLSYAVLKNLATEYDSKISQELIAPAEAVIAKAKEAKITKEAEATKEAEVTKEATKTVKTTKIAKK